MQHFGIKPFYIYRIPLDSLANLLPIAAGCQDFPLDILSKKTNNPHKKKEKRKTMQQPNNKMRGPLGIFTQGLSDVLHTIATFRTNCCLPLFFFSHVNTIGTSPETGNHHFPPGILWTFGFKWWCFPGSLHVEAGDAAERTERSCVSPSPSERAPALETATDELVPGDFFWLQV